MRPLPTLRLAACAALLCIQSSCGVLEPDGNNQLTLYVAPTTALCEGVGTQQCLLVKEHVAQEWSNFYGSIAGFTFEPGYAYTLLVEWHEVPDPPMDASSREYRLLRILARHAAPPSYVQRPDRP